MPAADTTDPRACAIDFLQHVTDELLRADDLSPDNPIVTTLLTALVEKLMLWRRRDFAETLPDAPELASVAETLPELCAEAESLMEKWWCRKLIDPDASSGRAELQSFWYFENYVSLVAGEWRLLAGCSLERIVFLGSGALPLTALLLAEDTECPVICVDQDEEACQLAAALIRQLGCSGRIAIANRPAAAFDFEAQDCVLCASLLEGRAHLQPLTERGVKTVLVRDGEGIFRFCYRSAAPLPPPYVAVSRTPKAAEHLNRSTLYVLRDPET